MNCTAPVTLQLNWRSGHPVPCESLWSVLHKFCFLNFVRGPAVIRHFGDKSARAVTMQIRRSDGRVVFEHDLRFAGTINLKRLRASLGIDCSWHEAVVLDGWGVKQEVRTATAPFLRYCPTCIEHGYHATMFQFVDRRTCPLHGDTLSDFCPNCGSRIPYSLPGVATQPYSCTCCGRRLWWSIHSDRWDPILETLNEYDIFSLPKKRSLMWLAPSEDIEERSALIWQSERGRSPWQWERLRKRELNGFTGAQANPTLIYRAWGDEFHEEPRPPHPPDSVYSVGPKDDTDFRQRIFETYCRIERAILRRFPASRRKRWLAMTSKVRYFDEIGKMPWSHEFMAYLIWRSYWFGSCWASFPRGHKMEREAHSVYTPQLSAVYWRFLQHARLLGPNGLFSSADSWAQLHFFAIVAFATHRAAEQLVAEVKLDCYPFKTNRCKRLEKAELPFVVLRKTAAGLRHYELRIWPLSSKHENA